MPTTHRGKRERLARLLREKQRRMGDSSLYYFSKYVVGFRDMELQPHWEICHFLQTHAGPKPPVYTEDAMILEPRGTFKSSLATVALPLWLLTKDRDLRFLIDSQKLTHSKNWLGLIRRVIEGGHTFRSLYGDWVNTKGTWTSTALSLKGRTKMAAENSITASSPETTKTSQHYDRYIGDDLQTGENINTAEAIDAVEQHVQLILPLLDPQKSLGGRRAPRLFVGTRWHFDDIYGRWIAKNKLARMKPGENRRPLQVHSSGCCTQYKLVGDRFQLGGKAYFPSRFPIDYLDKLQDTMSIYNFSCQYLNDPMPEGAAVFPVSLFNWFNSKNRVKDGQVASMPPMISYFVTVDPALSEKADSDYSAVVVVGTDAEWNMYVWDVIRGHWQPDALMDKIYEVRKKYNPKRIGIESVAFQRALVWGLRQKARDRGDWFSVTQLKTDNTVSKEMRIRGFEPFIRSRKVFFRVSDELGLTEDKDVLYQSAVEGIDFLIDEMIRFPLGATKDCVDALAYMPQLVFPAGTPGPPPPPPPNSFGALLDAHIARTRRQRKGILSEVR